MFLARTPHGQYDTAVLEEVLRAAGFVDLVTEVVTRESRAADALFVAIGYCQGTPMRGEIETDRLGEATEIAAAAIAERFGPGAVSGKIQAYVIAAVRGC